LVKKKEKDSTKLIVSKREQNKAELEQAVLQSIVMKLSEKESLAYIKLCYKPIESTRFYEVKKSLTDKMIEEGYRITSKNGLFEQHMMRIQTLEAVAKEQWKKYREEPKPFLQSAILERISKLQLYISSAYDYTRSIIKTQTELQLTIAKHSAPKLKTL